MPRDWSAPLGDLDPLPDGAADELRVHFRTQPETGEALQNEFTEAEAAAFLGMTAEALAKRRRAGTGPEWFSVRAKREATLREAGFIRPRPGVPSNNDGSAQTGGGRRADLGDLRYRREALEAWRG